VCLCFCLSIQRVDNIFFLQLVDDILDYEAGEATLGKPGGADLRLGLATGPALFAWEEHSELGPLISRRFNQEGDVEHVRIDKIRNRSIPNLTRVTQKAMDLVRRSSGVERTRELAVRHANQAKQILETVPDSEAKTALEVLTEMVVKRSR